MKNYKLIFNIFLIKYLKCKYFLNTEVNPKYFIKTLKNKAPEILDFAEDEIEINIINDSVKEIIELFDSYDESYGFNHIINGYARPICFSDEHSALEYFEFEKYLAYSDREYPKEVNTFLYDLIDIKKEDNILSFDGIYIKNKSYKNICIYSPKLSEISLDIDDVNYFYINIQNKLYRDLYFLDDLKKFNYMDQFDKVINLSNFDSIMKLDDFIRRDDRKEKYYPQFASVMFTIGELNETGKGIATIDRYALSHPKLIKFRMWMIEDKYIDSIIKLNNEYFVIVSNLIKDHIAFANFDNIGHAGLYINFDSEDIRNEVAKIRRGEEDLYIRNISYDKLTKMADEAEKILNTKSFNLNKKLLSLDPVDYVDRYKYEFESTKELNKELRDCYIEFREKMRKYK